MSKDDTPDSILHHEARVAKMRAAAADAAQQLAQGEAQRKALQADRDKATRHAQADELEARIGLIRENESRDMLIERIRKMREDVPPEIVHVPFRSPEQQAQFEAEQRAGREAVARAEADAERYREIRLKAELEAQAKEGTMVPVHHANPGQDEVFPTIKATLPGSGQGRKK